MIRKPWTGAVALAILVAGSLVLVGCGSAENNTTPAGDATTAEADPSHGGWWCVEHGVPEEECARCDTSLVAKFKEEGDWCDEHNRPESQCFVCSEERAEKFAMRYEAKTGHQPPQPTE